MISDLGYGADGRVYVSGLAASWLLSIWFDLASPIFHHWCFVSLVRSSAGAGKIRERKALPHTKSQFERAEGAGMHIGYQPTYLL